MPFLADYGVDIDVLRGARINGPENTAMADFQGRQKLNRQNICYHVQLEAKSDRPQYLVVSSIL